MFIKFNKILIYCFLVKFHYCLASNYTRERSNYTQDIYRPRIVGGAPTAAEKYPHNVLIHRLAYDAFCGGSIIAPTWILTAARCHAPVMAIYAGTNWLFGGARYKSTKTYFHPKVVWDAAGSLRYDFMLAKVTENIVFGHFVKPIMLSWSMKDIATGRMGYLPGFGVPYESYKDYYYILREISLPIIDFEKCKTIFSSGGNYLGKYYYYTSQVMKGKDAFCAGYMEGGRSMCKGDAGSGFIINGVLVGIASRSIGCGRPHTPNIISTVAIARDWICQTAGV